MKPGQFVKIKNIITKVETEYKIARIIKTIEDEKIELQGMVEKDDAIEMTIKAYKALVKTGVITEL